MKFKEVIQVYINSETYVNQWLIENKELEILDVKLNNDKGHPVVMVVYKTFVKADK